MYFYLFFSQSVGVRGCKKRTAGRERYYERNKTKKARGRIMKAEKERREKHEKWLLQQRKEAEEVVANLKSSVAGSLSNLEVTAASSAPFFPDDPADDISCLTPPVRLSPEEREQGSQDFTQFQKMIYKHVGERLRKKPKKFTSPFLLPKSRPNVPLSKALALRYKIASDEKLKE